MVKAQNITYQTYEENQPIYLIQNQQYDQQIYYQEDQTGQLYEYQQPEIQTEDYQNYYEIQQPYQQVISQHPKQPQTLAQQQAKLAQQRVKYSKQIAAQQRKAIQQKQVIQPSYASKNPYIRQPQQYQQQINPHFVEGSYVHEPKDQGNEEPQIQSDFQPEIPIANSVLTQSKIPFAPEKPQVSQGKSKIIHPPIQSNVISQQPQVYQQPLNYQQPQNFQQSYVVPRRNPNLKIKQYQNYNNESHFVSSVEPGSRTMNINPNLNSMAQIQKKDSKNIGKKLSGSVEPLSQKESKISEKSLEANYEPTQADKNFADGLFNKTGETKIGVGNSKIVEDVTLSKLQNIEKSDIKNIEPKMTDNYLESKIVNEGFEKENPIEEKSPDENNINDLNNLNNENDAFPQEISNQNQIGESNLFKKLIMII